MEPLTLVLMFQHSQQPAPLELNYHADLLGVPLVLFRVLVSFLSLQPRHRPTPDAHAHAQATPANFHSRHPAITLLTHSALLPRIPHLVLFSARTLQVLPVLLHSHVPLLTLLLRHADTHAPACPLDLAPLSPYALHSVRLPPSPAVSIMIIISISPCTTRSSCQSLPRASLSPALSHMLLFPFRTFIPCSTHLRHPSIPDPWPFVPVLTFFGPDVLASSTRCSHSPGLLSPTSLTRPPLLLCASSTDLSLGP
ncbi:hypothetical protein B0H13DRAFT_2317764 [Mycena leptocephala]|nr:hypothetical protein B0H13DRAFT_2317764 [Mycena leptocephala]